MKKSILTILSIGLITLQGCYAKEMYLSDPIVNFQEQGIKNILFTGFNNFDSLKVSPKFKTKLEGDIYKEFDRFNNINILKSDEKDKLPVNYNKDNLTVMAKKYNADLFLVGTIRNYTETKIIDQPVPGFNDNINSTDTNDLRSLNRFQIVITGSVSLVKPDGRVIWTDKIDDMETSQFEGLPSTNNPETDRDELAAFINTRNQLAEDITNKVLRNLLPYYSYK